MSRTTFSNSQHSGDPLDRIIVIVAVLVVMAPILAYSWVALDAERANRTQLALDRSLGTAQLAAGLVDEHCEKAVAVIQQLARHPSLSGYSSGSVPKASSHLRATLDILPDLDYVAWYGQDGRLLGSRSTGAATAPALQPGLVTRFQRESRLRRTAYIEHTVKGDTILLAVPISDGRKVSGCVTAALPSTALNAWLQSVQAGASILYVVDDKGHVLTSAGPAWHRHLPLGDYPPTRFALNGQDGALQIDGPDGSEECFVGYAYAAMPRCGVLVVLPSGVILGPTSSLVQRLALLLIPILLLVSAWAWQRVQSERRIGEMADKLALQNEALRSADQAKSQFLANVSHDLRTPLAAMQVSISGLLESPRGWTRTEVRDTLEVVSEEVDQLTARVRNLLDMARLEAGAEALSCEPCDLTDIVSSALERLAPLTRGRSVQVDFPPEPLMVDCDQARIETVVINLLENAVKYTPEGSTIYLQGRVADGDVMFRVWDDGQGLTPGDEEQVFKMFYRSGRGRAIRGTGVGLAICKAIIGAHGGEIRASRAQTGGAEFRFTLKALPAPVEAVHA